MPANACATGKVLLAGRLLRDPSIEFPTLTALTRYTITAPQLLRKELQKVQREEAAVSRDESFPNTTSVAVPVGPLDEVTHVLSVSGPADQLRPHEILRHLRVAAAATWAEVQAPPPRRRVRGGKPPATR